MIAQEVSKQRGSEVHRQPWAAAVLSVIALLVMLMSYHLGLFQNGHMGPGLWPFLAATVLLVSTLAMLISGSESVHHVGGREQTRFVPGRFLLAVVVLLGFAVLLRSFGAFTASAVAAFVWLRFLAGESWRMSGGVAVAMAGAIYIVFVQVLEIPLPVDAFLPR